MVKVITATRWAVRIASVLLAIFLSIAGVAIFGHSFTHKFSWPDLVASVSLLGVITGLVLAWPKEKIGIFITYAGLVGLITATMMVTSKDPFWVLWLAIPSTLLVLCRYAERKGLGA